MSEIKGQILGIVLVLMIFGAVATSMATVFDKLGNTVNQKVDSLAMEIESY